VSTSRQCAFSWQLWQVQGKQNLTSTNESFGDVARYISYQSTSCWSQSYPVKFGVNPGIGNGGNIAFPISKSPNMSTKTSAYTTYLDTITKQMTVTMPYNISVRWINYYRLRKIPYCSYPACSIRKATKDMQNMGDKVLYSNNQLLVTLFHTIVAQTRHFCRSSVTHKTGHVLLSQKCQVCHKVMQKHI